MKATKYYENGRVFVYVEDGDARDCLTFANERQMQQLGECLRDLARIGGPSVEIG